MSSDGADWRSGFDRKNRLEQAKGMADSAAGSLREVGIRFLSAGESGFIVPFEVISVLLLTAIIGAIVIARSSQEPSK